MNRTRTGSTLLEAIAGLTIMMIVCALVAQITVLATRQMRAGVMRQVAVQEAANVLDRIVADSSDASHDLAVANWPLSPEAEQQLSDGTIRVTVDDESAPPAAIRIAVEVSWKHSWGVEREQVCLVSWRYARGEDAIP